jgi:hypothetical protein
VDNGIDRAVDYLQFLQEFNQKDKKLGPWIRPSLQD